MAFPYHELDKLHKHFDTAIIFDTNDRGIYSIIGNLSSKRIVSHFQLNPQYLGTKSNGWKRALEVLQQSDVIIVPAEYLKVELKGMLHNQIVTVQNGVDQTIFQVKENHSDKPLFGYVGKVINSKGKQILEYIWKNIPEEVVLQIESNQETGLISKTKAQILTNFTGIDRTKHPTPTFDCLLSTSLSEVAPMVIIEALMSGVPVITTRSSPYVESLEKIFGSDIVTVIPLSARLQHLEVSQLLLSKQEVEFVGEMFLEKIRSFKKPSLKEKQRIRSIALANGFSSEQMTEKYKRIYLQEHINTD